MVVVVLRDGGWIDWRATHHGPRRRTPDRPVHVARIPRAALDVALDLAGGDRRRLRFDAATGSVIVANGPR